MPTSFSGGASGLVSGTNPPPAVVAAEIVRITLGSPPAGVTAFQLQFSADGGVTWTGYFTTGSTTEDLDINLLSGGVYLIDGVNGPTGNMAAASAPGLRYQARWKNAGGYGEWGPEFGVNDGSPALSSRRVP